MGIKTSQRLRILLTLLFLFLLSSCTQQPLLQDYKCPDCNVILISIDTLRADHLGCYGYERNTSPNLDRFAKHSVLFENVHSVSPWTLPSHGSMFTSLYPSQHGARSLGCAVFPDCFSKLRADVPTVATILNQSGYYTLGIVNSGFLSKGFGFDRGFDEYYLHGPEQHIKKGIEKIEEYIPLLKQNKFFLFFG